MEKYHNSSCNYTNLGNYNSSYCLSSGSGATGATGAMGTNSCDNGYMVPHYGAPGYNTLLLGDNCNGYADIESAYGVNAHHCNTHYYRRPCN